jgi:ATP-binding protein involved in chromosome partitioning
MPDVDPRTLLEPAATKVRDPVSGRSVWLAGMITEAREDQGSLKYTLVFDQEHTQHDRVSIQEAIALNLAGMGWAGGVICNVRIAGKEAAKPAPEPAKEPVRGMSASGGMQPHGGPIEKQKPDGVTHIVAVASGKGGVGKSTVATNLACALAQQGHKVGLMDADIYGPSLPLMMNVTGQVMSDNSQRILPLFAYGVKCMSIGFLVDEREPVIWRGPMVMGVVRQFLQQVRWAPLDYLIVDLPPGTGDAQLTMIQATPISGAVIVSTPQDVALLDARRGLEMFRKLDVPILGVVENMAWMDLPDGTRMHPFGDGGAKRLAEAEDLPLLAQVPLDGRIREAGDHGAPIVLAEGGHGTGFEQVARAVAERLPPQ